MNRQKLLMLANAVVIVLILHFANISRAQANSSDQAFLGRWDLTLKTPGGDLPSWLEITEKDGQFHAQFVSRFGHARDLPKVEISSGHILFVSPKEDEETKADVVFKGTLSGGKLSGTTTAPDGSTWQWTGVRAPKLIRASEPKWGSPMQLFDGKDLKGWKPSDPAAKTSWTVDNGTLVSPGHGPELITTAKFEDFKLHIEFNCGKGANSGVYLRGRYELQIEDDPEPEGPTMRTGGVYGFLAPKPEPARRPGEWQTYDITLVGRVVTVVLNGQTIIDKQEIPGITGGALDSHEGMPGPIYLQGSEAGHVAFRNITITPAK